VKEISTHKVLLRDSWGQVKDGPMPRASGAREVTAEIFG
jgi:hypothetical protein